MSENTKKRSRKSKLVPRTYDLYDNKDENDDAGTSYKALSTKLKKIKKEMENDVANPLQNYMTMPMQNYVPSPMQFSIKVEVEECDELNLDIKEEFIEDDNLIDVSSKCDDSQDSVQPMSISDIDISKEADKLLMKAENIHLDQDMSQECSDSSLALEELLSNTPQDLIIDQREMKRKFFLLSKEDILSYQPDPNDIPGKMLYVEVRNGLGRSIKSSLEIDRHDALIQTALMENQIAVGQFRDTLIMYKCYICTEAWWHLYPFREHIRQHDDVDLMVSTESYNGLEINMIAYKGTVPRNKNIEIHSNCWHCGKFYDIHKQPEGTSKTSFDCFYCTEKFVSCIQLISHEGVCFWQMHKMLENKAQCYNCPYCMVIVFSNAELQDHLVVRHSVRSDVPMLATFKLCPYCKGKYHNFNFHVCPKRMVNKHKTCLYCNRKFPFKILSDAHLLLSKKNVKCPVCGIVLVMECMMTGHLLEKHSTDFTFCSKCALCKDIYVFLDEEAQREHRIVRHNLKYDRRRCVFEMVLIPNKLLVNPCPALKGTPDTIMMSPSSVLNNVVINSNNTMEPNSDVSLEGEKDVNDEARHNVTQPIKMEKNISDTEMTDYENIIQINQIGAEIIIKSEQNEIEPDNYNIHVSDIKQEVEDVDAIETDTEDYEQLLSNVFRVSENFTTIRNEVKIEPQDEISEDDLLNNENMNLDSLEPEVILKPGCRKRRLYKCNKCGYKDYHREYRLHLKNKCEPVKEVEEKSTDYGCTKCNRNYSSMKRYIQHFTQHGYNCNTCPECSQEFENLTLLSAHITCHVRKSYVKLLLINRLKRQKKVLQCKKCKGKVVLENFFAHWESHLELGQVTGQDELEKCEEDCVHTALEAETLKELIKLLVYSDRRHKYRKVLKNCNVCHRHFDRVNDCKRHLIEHLLVDAYANKQQNQVLKCQICCEGFRKGDRYKEHMRDHGSLPIYKCELCNKTFSDSSNFTKHKKIHNLRVLICDICGKKFQAKISIEKHMKVHLTTEPIKCNECPKVFHIVSAYKKHIRTYHDKTQLKYRCLMCFKRFSCLKDKWDHMWIIHKERKQKADCPICNKSFRKYHDVKAHVRNEHKMGFTVFKMQLFDNQAKKQMADALEKSLVGVNEGVSKAVEDETLIVFE